MISKSILITFSFLFLLRFNVQAQSGSAYIEGIISDKTTNRHIEFANIQLIRLPDSTLLNNVVSDKRGKFIIENVSAGNYFLRSSYVGYDVQSSPPFLFTGIQNPLI